MTVALVKSPSLFAEKLVGRKGRPEMEMDEYVYCYVNLLYYVCVNIRSLSKRAIIVM